ncbi:MAG TPA: ATP-binding protein [Spirochaetia bacterium]|nr:ATP-binding protein [Spirochaetia bacterium]
MLVIFRGLPGTGKTHLARRLVERRPDFLILSRDSLRTAIFPRPTFGDDEKDLVDDLIASMAGFILRRGSSIVIDGMALSSAHRLEGFASIAAANQKAARIIECICSEATALARIAADTGNHPAEDRGPELYHRVRERFESTELPLLRIDTDGNSDENLNAILGYIENPPV